MRVKVAALLLAGGLLTACSPSDFFLGEDNRPAAKPLPQVGNLVQTQILWSAKPGAGGEKASLSLSPDGDETTIYAVSANGELAAYDAQNGNIRFSRSLGKDITAGVRFGSGLLFLGTRNGELLALNSSDGQTVWRAGLGSAILARPVVSGDMVVVRSNDGGIFAYSVRDGSQLWQYRISDPQLSIRGYAEPVVGGGIVILTTDGGRFIILDQVSGLPVAEQRIAVGSGHNDIQRLVDIDATPLVNRDILFGSAYQANTFAIDLQRGEPLWVRPGISTAEDFALSPDGVFLHDDIDHVFALNQRDGSVRWENDDLEGRRLSPMVAIPGRVGSIDSEGYLHWFDIDSGQLIGQNKIGSSNALGAPFVGRSVIVWQLADGNIVAIRPQ